MNLNTYTQKQEKPVLVIGASGVDIVGRLKSELLIGTSNPAQIRVTYGGAARNVAENLALLGQEVVILTCVGDDADGDRLMENAIRAGINTEYAIRSKKYPTGSYIGVLGANGNFKVALDDMRIVNEITPDYIKKHEHLFREACYLFIDTNLSSNTIKTVMSLAKKNKLKVCADPTSISIAEKLIPYLDNLFLITPNAAEAGLLSRSPNPVITRKQAIAAAKGLVSQGVRLVIITMAEQGLCYATTETSGHIPAIRTDIADPTGAGDSLTAAVLFALINQIELDDAVRLGVSAATLTLQHPGAVFADLSLEKLYDRLVI